MRAAVRSIAAGEEDDDQERFPFDLVAKKELEDRYEIVAAWSLPVKASSTAFSYYQYY